MSKNLIWNEDTDYVYGLKVEFKNKEEFIETVKKEYETFDIGKMEIKEVTVEPCLCTESGLPAEAIVPLSATNIVIENYYLARIEPIED